MKRVLFILLCFIPFVMVNAAGSVNVSTSNIALEEGKTITFTITADNSAGRVDISSTDTSVATVSTSSFFLDNNSTTITVNAKSSGAATIIVKLTDVATYDGDELTGSKDINVTVKSKKEKTPINTTGNNNDKKEEEKKEEVKDTEQKEDNKIEPKIILNVVSFSIYGYSLDFDENVYEYDLDIDRNVSKIFIETTCNECEITGDKWVDISNSNQIIVNYKKETTEKNYTINLKKFDLLKEKESDKKDDKINIILLIVSIVLGLGVIVLLILLLKNKGNKEEPIKTIENTVPMDVPSLPVSAPITPEPISEVEKEEIIPIVMDEQPEEIPTISEQPEVLSTPTTQTQENIDESVQ